MLLRSLIRFRPLFLAAALVFSFAGSLQAQTAVKQLNAGGPAVAPFAADNSFSAGSTFSGATAINVSGVTNAAPAAVYQTVRWNSAFNYTLTGLTAGSSYQVRLHFVELSWTAAGQRKFNVAINGTAVLTAFDIFAQVGQNHALVQQFNATANSSGQIVVAFSQGGADNPSVAGIEVLTASVGRSPYGGTNWPIANGTTIQAENYDLGGEGVAYHDADVANQGGLYRTDGVDIEATTDSGTGYNVGWINDGEWLDYTTNTTAGNYNIVVRGASNAAPAIGSVKVLLDGIVLGTVAIPNTGGWQNWQDFTISNVAIAAGTGRTLQLQFVGGGFNLNYVRFVSNPVTYPLTVANGTGSGNYAAGTVVNIVANPPPAGQVFSGWTGGTATNFGNAASATTTYKTTSVAQTIVANYTVTTYPLTVTSGSGSGNYAPGTVVTITANTPPAGAVFVGWTGGTAANFGNNSSLTTTYTTTAAAQTIVATYIPGGGSAFLTVTNGTGSGNYVAGTVVTITANAAPAGQVFAGWVGGTAANFGNAAAATTTYTTTAAAQTITATYRPATFALTVNGGSGSGNYVAGTVVTIGANTPQAGQVFASWTGGTAANFGNAASATTTYTTIAAAQTITATYAPISGGPIGGINWPINNGAIIQAENYDLGGEGIAYHDTTTGNTGGQFRTDGVDIEACTDTGGGFNVGWTVDGEWLKYTTNTTAGTYNIVVRGASASTVTGTKSVRVLLDGTLLGTATMGITNGWQTWQDFTISGANIPAGTGRILRLEVVGGDFNVNYVRFATTAVTFPLTVASGTGSGNYAAGTVVTIVANPPPAGQVFAGWTGGTAVNFGNAASASTTYTTTGAAQTITATYSLLPTFALTVTNGSGSGNYVAGAIVSISANPPGAGQVFAGWTGGTTANFGNRASATTIYTTTAAATTITATYTIVPTFALTVTSGTGSGNYTAGTVVSINANPPPTGQSFSGWTGGTATNFGSTSSSATTYTTVAAAQTIVANYTSSATTTGALNFHLLLGAGSSQDTLTLTGDNYTDLIISNYIAGVMCGHLIQEYYPGLQFNKDYLYGSIFAQLLQENIATQYYVSSSNLIDPSPNQQAVMGAGQGGPYQINNYAVDMVAGTYAPAGHSLINFIAVQKNIGYTMANAATQVSKVTPPSFNNKYYGPMLCAYFHYNDFVALNITGKGVGGWTTPWEPMYDQALANFVHLPNSFLEVILNVAYNQGYYGGLVTSYSTLGQTATASTVASVNSYTSVWGSSNTYAQYPYQVHYYLDQIYDNPVPTTSATTFVTPANHIVFNVSNFSAVFSNVFQTLAYSNGTNAAQFFTAAQAQAALNSALTQQGVSGTGTFDLSNSSDRARMYAVIDSAISNLELAVGMQFTATTNSQL